MKPVKQGQPLGYIKESILKDTKEKGRLGLLIQSNRHIRRLVEWGYLAEEISGISLFYTLTDKGAEYLSDLGDYPEPPETEAQIDAYLRKHGYDPEQLAKDARDIFKEALENSPLDPKNLA